MSNGAVRFERRELVKALRLAAWLLLLSNVGWACWFAVFVKLDGEHVEMHATEPIAMEIDPEIPSLIRVAYRRSFFSHSRHWVYRTSHPFGNPAEEISRQRAKGVGSIVQSTPAWLYRRFSRTPIGVSSEYWGEVSVAVGWPVRLLWCSWRMDDVGWVTTWDTGIRVDMPLFPASGGYISHSQEPFSTAIPFRPILVGQLLHGLLCFLVAVVVRRCRFARTARHVKHAASSTFVEG